MNLCLVLTVSTSSHAPSMHIFEMYFYDLEICIVSQRFIPFISAQLPAFMFFFTSEEITNF